MANKGYVLLKEVYADNGQPTGATKLNVSGDPDYVTPFPSSDCGAIITTTSTTTSSPVNLQIIIDNEELNTINLLTINLAFASSLATNYFSRTFNSFLSGQTYIGNVSQTDDVTYFSIENDTSNLFTFEVFYNGSSIYNQNLEDFQTVINSDLATPRDSGNNVLEIKIYNNNPTTTTTTTATPTTTTSTTTKIPYITVLTLGDGQGHDFRGSLSLFDYSNNNFITSQFFATDYSAGPKQYTGIPSTFYFGWDSVYSINSARYETFALDVIVDGSLVGSITVPNGGDFTTPVAIPFHFNFATTSQIVFKMINVANTTSTTTVAPTTTTTTVAPTTTTTTVAPNQIFVDITKTTSNSLYYDVSVGSQTGTDIYLSEPNFEMDGEITGSLFIQNEDLSKIMFTNHGTLRFKIDVQYSNDGSVTVNDLGTFEILSGASGTFGNLATPRNYNSPSGGINEIYIILTEVPDHATFNWSNSPDQAPFVDSEFIIQANGVTVVSDTTTTGSGTYTGNTYDTVLITQGGDPTVSPWPANSMGRLVIIQDGTTIYDNTVTTESAIYNSYSLSVNGGSVYTITATTVSTANVNTNHLIITNTYGSVTGSILTELIDTTSNSAITTKGNPSPGNSSSELFNSTIDANTITVRATNNSSMEISILVTESNGFSQNVNVAANGGTYDVTGLTKNLDVNVSILAMFTTTTTLAVYTKQWIENTYSCEQG